MNPVNFFSIASQQDKWLAVRQSIVAQNIANANTPGYKSLDVEPFEAVMQSTSMSMSRTNAAHLVPTSGSGSGVDTSEQAGWQVLHSGNSVNVEDQMLKAGEISGAYARNTSVMKTLHRMLLASAKG